MKCKKTVLFLDDSSNMREFFENCIIPDLKNEINIECVSCGTYNDAIKNLNGDIFTAVLDYCLGEERNGITLYKEIRGLYPELPVVIFSSHPDILERVCELNERDFNLYANDKNWKLLKEQLISILGD